MTFMVSDNQYGRPHPSNSWDSCYYCSYYSSLTMFWHEVHRNGIFKCKEKTAIAAPQQD